MEPVKVSLVEIAIRKGTRYQRAYDRAMSGEFGEVIRDASRRIYILVPQNSSGRAPNATAACETTR